MHWKGQMKLASILLTTTYRYYRIFSGIFRRLYSSQVLACTRRRQMWLRFKFVRPRVRESNRQRYAVANLSCQDASIASHCTWRTADGPRGSGAAGACPASNAP